jgi:Zn-dependent metalloprotease
MPKSADDNKFSSLSAIRSQRSQSKQDVQPVQQQDSQTAEQQNDDAAKLVKATFYLLPTQPDDIDEWQLKIKRQTGRRVEKSELVRYALTLLAEQFDSKTAKEVYEHLRRSI